jgi:hypothetical protein
MTHDQETGRQHARRSRLRRSARVSLIATSVLAVVGLLVAKSVGDQTPPYEPSLINELAWSLFMICSVASLLLALLLFGWLIADDNRR